MRSITISILFITLFCNSILNAQEKIQDVLYLKDGSIIRGTIIEKVENDHLKIKTIDGNELIYKMTEIVQIIQVPILKKADKSPLLSCCLSLLFPGLGQHYNGDHKKGFIQEGIFITGGVLSISAILGDWTLESATNKGLFLVGFGVGLGARLWSVIDAPIRANQINKQIRQSYGHLIEFRFKGYAFGIDLEIPKDQIASKIYLHF
jgi:TM2 domain-containing membrane protein YozV